MKSWLIVALASSIATASVPTEDSIQKMLEQGLGIQAHKMIQQHFDGNIAWHHRHLGNMYLKGIGIQQNPTLGWKHIDKAAELGDPLAAEYLLKEPSKLKPSRITRLKTLVAMSHPDKTYSQKAFKELIDDYLVDSNRYRNEINQLLENCTLAEDFCQTYLAVAVIHNVNNSISKEDAEILLTKAAASGDPMAIYMLGMENYKKGTPESFQIAFELFTQGKAQNDGACIGALGTFYELGLVVKRDLDKALALFEEAASLGVEWTQARIDRINKIIQSPKLFGEHLYGLNKARLQAALRTAGVRHMGTNELADLYDAKSIFPDATTLTAAYSPYQPYNLAEMYYFFPKRGNMGQKKLQLAEMLAKRYGEPQPRRVTIGSVEKKSIQLYEWRMDDIQIVIQEDPKTDGLVLAYRIKPFINELRQYVAQANQDLKEKSMLPF